MVALCKYLLLGERECGSLDKDGQHDDGETIRVGDMSRLQSLVQ